MHTVGEYGELNFFCGGGTQVLARSVRARNGEQATADLARREQRIVKENALQWLSRPPCNRVRRGHAANVDHGQYANFGSRGSKIRFEPVKMQPPTQ